MWAGLVREQETNKDGESTCVGAFVAKCRTVCAVDANGVRPRIGAAWSGLVKRARTEVEVTAGPTFACQGALYVGIYVSDGTTYTTAKSSLPPLPLAATHARTHDVVIYQRKQVGAPPVDVLDVAATVKTCTTPPRPTPNTNL